MGVGGVVILYHPAKEVADNIQTYLPYVDTLYIADNTEGSMSSVAAQFRHWDKVTILHDGSNKGIAKQLNDAAALAIEAGYNWLLTMDQDSRFDDDDIHTYLICSGSYTDKHRCAVFGVQYEAKTPVHECSAQQVSHVITSGSILNLAAYAQVGAFDEALFIDEVDVEYCYRAIGKGYHIAKFSNVFMQHHLGETSMRTSYKSLLKTPRSLHSPARLYYMVRNYLYVAKQYKHSFAKEDDYRRKALLTRIKNNLLYGSSKYLVLQSVIKGYLDYKKGNMGSITSPQTTAKQL